MTNKVSSQVANPWRAVKRTVTAITAAAVPTLLALAAVLQIVAETFDGSFPVEVIAWATGAAAFLILCAGAFTRIMAVPGVNEWLAKWNLEATAAEDSKVKNGNILPTVPDYTPLDK